MREEEGLAQWPAAIGRVVLQVPYVSFIELLKQIATHFMPKNNRNLFSHSSRSQKSEGKVLAESHSL